MITAFLIITMLFFAGMGASAVHQEFPGTGDTVGKCLALFFMFMAGWAAGLLLAGAA